MNKPDPSDRLKGAVRELRKGRVILDESESVVRKLYFRTETSSAFSLAKTEFERLRRFSEVLDQVDGAACPLPLALIDTSPPEVRMEYVAGDAFLAFLGRQRLEPHEARHLADVAARVLDSYIATFDEPYSDFQFDNMLYDPGAQRLTFVDLLPGGDRVVLESASALEASLGNLIGSTMFQSARPKWALRLLQHEQTTTLCTYIVDHFLRAHRPDLTRQGLRRATVAAYEQSAFTGSLVRTGWYRSAGFALARRIRVGGDTYAPTFGRGTA